MAIVQVTNTETGEIKTYSGKLAAHKFLIDNPGWLVWSS